MSEFSHLIEAARLPTAPVTLEADAAQRAALARRFGLVAITRLHAAVALAHDGPAVAANGDLRADIVQSCAVSGDDVPVAIREPIALRFVPPATSYAEDTELDAADLDEIEMDHGRFDLGEAVAQTLALAIDPYLEGPGAEAARRAAGLIGEGEAGPLAGALKDLFKKP